MDIEYIKNNYEFETLNEKHELSNFESASEELNKFLKEDALNQQKQKLNLTKLIICDNQIIGYVTLLADGIRLKDIKNKITKNKNSRKIKQNPQQTFYLYLDLVT